MCCFSAYTAHWAEEVWLDGGEAMKRHSRKGIHRCSVRSMRYIGWAVRHGASSVG